MGNFFGFQKYNMYRVCDLSYGRVTKTALQGDQRRRIATRTNYERRYIQKLTTNYGPLLDGGRQSSIKALGSLVFSSGMSYASL